ncbi:hypothetical protein [Azonexus hydrophilus]|uniref:Uncharacterized protein n=1 Tax=Azonexus hydrophilus TaxID=418702 RepID=A0ABZ2XG24_9RHOO
MSSSIAGDFYNEITIRSDIEAWELFQRAINGDPLPERLKLKFVGWPNFEVKIQGKDWFGTVPTRVMGPLLEIQKDIHRIYASIQYGESSARRLKDEEREALEIVVKVDEGSSDFKASLTEQLNELADKAFAKMDSRDIAIVILGLALVYGGVEVSKAWIAERQAGKEMEKVVQLSQQETERLRIFSEAMQKKPILSEAKTNYEDSQNRLLKAVKSHDVVNIKGVQLGGSDVSEIVQTERARSTEHHIEGVFQILANDVSKSSGYRIKISRLADALQFSANVPMELPFQQKEILKKAEWSKGTVLVNLSIRATILRGNITDAVVLSVTEVSE